MHIKQMKYEELNLFATPVFHFKNFLKYEEIESAIQFIKQRLNFTYEHWLLTNHSVSSHGKQNFLYEIAEEKNDWSLKNGGVLDRINTALKFVSSKTGIVFDGINYSWFNIQTKNSILKDHLHHYSGLVGALYIKTDNQSSPLVFKNPLVQYDFVVRDPNFRDNYNGLSYEIYPSSGDLIIFPFYLYHGSNGHTNLTEERIAVSFNCT